MSLKREVSVEWSLGWGLVIINQQIKYFFILPWNLLQLLFQAARECLKKLSLLVILCVKFPQVSVHQYINELVICVVKLVIFVTTVYEKLIQPRSQGSLLPALRSERERDPGKCWSHGSRTKLILREESFVSHFFVWFIRNVHAVIATAG